MDVRHDDPELEEMEANPEYSGRHGVPVVRGFRKVMNIIRQSLNETVIRNFAGLRLEKLKGKRSHQHSMRINDQWRLIVEFIARTGPNNNLCAVKELVDYHP